MVYNTKFQAFPNAKERQALTPNESNYKFRLWSCLLYTSDAADD